MFGTCQRFCRKFQHVQTAGSFHSVLGSVQCILCFCASLVILEMASGPVHQVWLNSGVFTLAGKEYNLLSDMLKPSPQGLHFFFL